MPGATATRENGNVTSQPMFEIHARDPGSRARAGTLHLAHGDVATPAFVPLATRGSVKTLEPRDVEALGYEMVLGNTFHLFLSPGQELMGELGGLNRFMRWPRPIITDSGGFQIFSMGHGGVADEIKGRRAHRRRLERRERRHDERIDPRDRGAGRAVSLLHRWHRAVPRPRDVDGDAGGDRVGHRARARRVHAVSLRLRLHGPVDGTHPPLADRCLEWHEQRGSAPTRPCTRSSRAARTPICG